MMRIFNPQRLQASCWQSHPAGRAVCRPVPLGPQGSLRLDVAQVAEPSIPKNLSRRRTPTQAQSSSAVVLSDAPVILTEKDHATTSQPNEPSKPAELMPRMPGQDHHRYDFPDGPAWELVARRPLAGGTLDIIRWEGRRMLRVWTPPGYDKASAQLAGGLPSVLLHDGQNLFDSSLCLSGSCWQVAETAAQLITSGQLPPFVIIGVDHAGLSRSYEYTPVTPGTAPGGFRQDAANWPGGGVWQYLARLVDEVLPHVTRVYALSERPEDRVMGGSSFGGIATLCAALRYPDVWACSLVESPSLWIGNEEFLKETIAQHITCVSKRMFIGMGGKEFSGVRPPDIAAKYPTADATVEGYAATLADMMQTKGVHVKVVVESDATHTESAWAKRLPTALQHVCSHWWLRELQNRHGHLLTTVPKRLRPGCPAVLLVNRARSATLAHADDITMVAGFNMDWEMKLPDTRLQRVSRKLNDLADSSYQRPHQFSDDWWMCSFDVPVNAYEMHLALYSRSTGTEVWDNNAGSNFYMPLAPALPSPIMPSSSSNAHADTNMAGNGVGMMMSAAEKKAREALAGDHQKLAHKNSSRLFFSIPETLIAGAPAMFYINKKRSAQFHDQPNIKLHYGWNGWDSKMVDGGAARVDFKPTCLWRDEGTDWWAAQLQVPEAASELNFAFTNGDWLWDSNHGHNYTSTVMALAADAADAGPTVHPRKVESKQELPHGSGTMHILHLQKRAPTDPGYTKQGRWVDEKLIRVWTPPGWSPDADKAPPGGWPVLYLSDGQNKFEDFLAHQGVSWSVGYQSSDLVSSGQLPPYIVVGIDSAGPMRSLNYLPYPPGTGQGGFRGDAERWPGGGVAQYMTRVTQEIMPLIQQQFNASDDPVKVAFGGGSFGGVCALYAAMHYPHMFGSILAESPSFWIAEGRFIGDLAAHKGPLPQRIFLGCGTREYSATRDHERLDVDALLLHYCCDAARILEEKGCRPGQGRLRFHVEPEAGHHEGAWKWRFSGAMLYLFSHLWDLQPVPGK